MKCIAYLGGGHTKPEWYRKSILEFGLPIAYTQEEVYERIAEYFPDLQKDTATRVLVASKAIPPGNVVTSTSASTSRSISNSENKEDKDNANNNNDYPGMNRPFSIKF